MIFSRNKFEVFGKREMLLKRYFNFKWVGIFFMIFFCAFTHVLFIYMLIIECDHDFTNIWVKVYIQKVNHTYFSLRDKVKKNRLSFIS